VKTMIKDKLQRLGELSVQAMDRMAKDVEGCITYKIDIDGSDECNNCYFEEWCKERWPEIL